MENRQVSTGAEVDLNGQSQEPESRSGSVQGAGADGRPIDFAVPKATAPRPVPGRAPLDHPHLYYNRELSALDFNWRVLYHAIDERVPLLERVRFLSITSSNLDEFFRKRVGGLKRQQAAGVRYLSPDGRTPQQQLDLIRSAVLPHYETLGKVWHDLKPLLKQEAGIVLHDYEHLKAAQKKKLHTYFQDKIFPILTPLAGSARSVPWIATGSTPTPAGLARSNAPSFHSFITPVFERVPSGNIITDEPSASTSRQRANISSTLSLSPRRSGT